MCVVLLRRTDHLDLVHIDTLKVGMAEKLRPWMFIRAEFHVRGGVSTPTPPKLIVVVSHIRSGRVKTGTYIKSKNPDNFMKDAWVSFPVDDVSISKR